ncbi:MAG: iron-containing alcohol dehydrogenase [Chloroflexi bacterium]|nr:iron-containing alcohol dehydrogenase [Chloroflexota bacterium]
MNFEIAAPGRILFGAGRLAEIGALAAGMGRKALVVSGKSAERCARLVERLEAAGVVSVVIEVRGEPTVDDIQAGVARASGEGCDLVIGYGGGSAMDTGKAVAALLANGGELLDYLEVIGKGKALEKPAAPLIAIPTTAGTGAEATRNAVIGSPQHGVKVSLRSAGMLPRLALVDPELTYDLPPEITAATGLDALTQLIEPLVCNQPNPFVDALCRDGVRRAARSLLPAYTDGENAAAREDMALASLFSGLALANARLGAVHGFAGVLGGMTSAAHGAICACLLPIVMEVNLRALRQRSPDNPALARYAEAAKLLTGSESAAAEDGAAWTRELVAQCKIPTLRQLGLEETMLAEAVAKSARASSMKGNPIPLSEEEMFEILKRAIA